MATRIDLRGGGMVIVEKSTEVARLTKTDLLLSRNEADITTKFKVPSGVRTHAYYFNEDILGGGWECISGPLGIPRPQPGDWPSAQRERR